MNTFQLAKHTCRALMVCSAFIIAACSDESSPDQLPAIVKYGQQCEALIGKIPAFNCNDGVDVPITVDGKVPSTYQPRMTCDRPAMLPYNEDTFGQCTPYSKILDLSQGSTQISAFCRREHLRDPNSEFYDEVDIILHSVETGDTCWFHAETDAGDSKGFKASRVPPPAEQTPPPGQVAAVDFWWTPEATAKKNCSSCHDADPFMYSAYIGQVWQHVPVDPIGWYNSDIGEAFKSWPALESMSTEGNTCVGCHRIGNKNSCDKHIIASAAGMQPIEGGNELANSYPLKNWMPVNNFHSEDFWNEVYLDSALKLISCCDDPTQAMCQFKPITGKPR
jgi:hypothetical protein